MSKRLRLAALAATVSACAVAVVPASASAASWSCRASAYHHQLQSNPMFEPVKADPVPCAAAGTGAAQSPGTASVPANLASTGTLSASTSLTPVGASLPSQTAAATGKVENLRLTIPNVPLLALTVREASASATARCVNGVPALDGTSESTGLGINNVDLPVATVLNQLNTVLAPFNQVIQITQNERVLSGTSLVQRALHIRVLNAAGTPLLDAVAGEAIAGYDGSVCSADAGPPTLPPEACPSGSTFDTTRGACVIRISVAGQQDRFVTVSDAFGGPTGGTVMPLAEARKRYGHVRCLRGDGPEYAVVGTNKADLITGGNGRDRILLLGGNDRSDGGRGDDCIDGGSGRDVVGGNLGKDRLYGMSGNDALNGGPSTDMLDGGSGNDTLNAAYGADRVIGGSGKDAINVATAGPAARVSCGSGKDKVRVNNNERKRTSSCETRFVLKDT